MIVPPPVTFSTMKFCLSLSVNARRDLARGLVGRSAGRIGHDDGDGAARIVLRRTRRGEGEQTEHGQCNGDNAPHHSLLPGC